MIESHKSVPPGIRNVPTGPYRGDVIETPADGYRDGGFVYQRSMQTGGFTEGGEIDESLDAVTTEHYSWLRPEVKLLSSGEQQQTLLHSTSQGHIRTDMSPTWFKSHGPKETCRIQDEGGPGRGMLQFENECIRNCPKKRHRLTAKAMGLQPDPEIMSATSLSADQLSKDQQY